MIRKNSSSLTSPSPSLSASSIISCAAEAGDVSHQGFYTPCMAAQMRTCTRLQLLIRHVLAQLLGHALQVLEGDLARLVIVKQPERLRRQQQGAVSVHVALHA